MLNFIRCRQILIYKCRKERIKYISKSHCIYAGAGDGISRYFYSHKKAKEKQVWRLYLLSIQKREVSILR